MTTQTQDRTASIITALLRQSTGRSFLDSGDAYGRHWEQNRKRKFAVEPRSTVEFSRDNTGKLEYEIYASLFHHLNDNLVFDEDMHKRYSDYRDMSDSESSENDTLEAWLESIDAEIVWRNVSVDSENSLRYLDQSFEYVEFYFSNGGASSLYIAVSVHGGCDLRSGWSEYVIFTGEENALDSVAVVLTADDPVGDRQGNLPLAIADPITSQTWILYDEEKRFYRVRRIRRRVLPIGV